MNEIFTIELNLDDDFSKSTAYHVDDFESTMRRNIQHAEQDEETSRWVLIGLAPSLSQACDECEQLRLWLCRRNNREPKSLGLE